MNKPNQKLFSVIMALAMIVTIFSPASVALAEGIDPSFDPGMLIPDSAFTDTGTFGSAAGIQKFLEQNNSVLANKASDFVAKLKEPDTLTKVGLEDPQPSLSKPRTAAELIYDAGMKHGLNPQVILVKLEKEQSLITGKFTGDTLQKRLDRAVGFGCPDYEGCGEIFLSFYRQLFGTFDGDGARWLGAAASLSRSFNTDGGRGPMVDAQGRVFGKPLVRTSKVGDTIVLDNTLGGYEGVQQFQTVKIGNRATAALYRFTPHVFNGNYNFWKLYTRWFKYPSGTVIKTSKSDDIYVLDNGNKRLFSTFVATQRKLNVSAAVTVSKKEFDSYETADPMTPIDGTLIKGDDSGSVFLVKNSQKRPISYNIFVQQKFSFANVVTLPQDEVDSYDTGGFVPPTEGTLVTGETDGTVYMIEGDLKRPISYEMFIANKFSFAKILKLSDDEIKAFATGEFVRPPDSVALTLKGDTGIYWYKDSQKRYVSAFVYKQRTVSNFPHVQIGLEEFTQLMTGTPFPPKDGTVIQGEGSTAIYIMENGVKRMLTAQAYARLKTPRATVLPLTEVESYASGEILAQ